jgi:1-pyrroline-5-carboxylate dehydrogenase
MSVGNNTWPLSACLKIPPPVNEPVKTYIKGSVERESLETRLVQMAAEQIEAPCVIGGQEIRTGTLKKMSMPHAHAHQLGVYHQGGKTELESAIKAALKAKAAWQNTSWNERANVFLKAADRLSGTYRNTLNAATMLGQSKSVYQAEVDAACELIDFWRFNVGFYQQMLETQPISGPGMWNQMDYRPLEGFVLAITPFNFTAIAGNLPTAPALMGNTVVWKPSHTQMFSAHYIMRLLQECGLPDGVINLVPSEGRMVSEVCLPHKDFAGIHFTGSTDTFNTIYKGVAENLGRYRSYPRMVGETGGKDYIFAHPSADFESLTVAMIRGAFEYQGQKCSAASRTYIPSSLWKKVKPLLVEQLATIKIGDVRDFSCFMNAVIDEKSFKNVMGYIDGAKASSSSEIIFGGKGDSSKGYFIEPTVIKTKDPKSKTMVEEIFGPVLTVFVYEDAEWRETLKICEETSNYALTGAIFAQCRDAVAEMSTALRHSAGNFYINDKPTGAVVGQQPFGGARASGTNDKAGSILNLYRWTSPRTIKETFDPPKNYRYPFLG